MWLKQSTAATVALGPFVDSTDGFTAETGLTISQADIRLSKNGGAFAQTNNSAGATHMENGYYSVPLDTTDTGTLGRLRVAVNESGALPVWQDFLVLPANVYDSMIAGSDKLAVDTQEWAGATTDGGDVALAAAPSNFAALAVTAGGAVTAGTISDKTGYSLSSAGITAIWDILTAALTTVGSIGKLLVDQLDAAISSTAAPGDPMTLAANAITDAVLAADTDTYQAKVILLDDEDNSVDRYAVSWFKNGQPINAGITVPKIQVVKVADGSDLVAETAMTQIAALGRYRYTASAAERITSGLAYLAIVTATIDGSTRSWDQYVGRDSS